VRHMVGDVIFVICFRTLLDSVLKIVGRLLMYAVEAAVVVV